MRYSKEKLVGRDWHKVVLHEGGRYGSLAAVVQPATARLVGDYMMMSGGHWYLVMIAEEEDLILFKMLTGFTEEDYRGYGDWSKVKRNNAKTNRIPPAK